MSATHKNKELNLNLIHELPSKPRKDGQYHGLTSVALLEKWSVLLSTQHGPLLDPKRRHENYLDKSVRFRLLNTISFIFNHIAQRYYKNDFARRCQNINRGGHKIQPRFHLRRSQNPKH